MGIRITTDDFGVKVWRSDKFGFPQYAVRISKRQASGDFVNEYQPIKFRKGVELANGDEIYINDAFSTLEVWQDKQTGETRHKQVWQIMDFSYRARQEQPQTHPQHATPMPQQPVQMQMSSQFTDLPDAFQAIDDDLPY
jgi:hypothetical protein